MPKPVRCEEKHEKEVLKNETTHPVTSCNKNNSFLSNLQIDDIILIAIVLLLLVDGCDDNLLILAIAFVFISGI